MGYLNNKKRVYCEEAIFIHTPQLPQKRENTHIEFPKHCQTSSESTLEIPPRMNLQPPAPDAVLSCRGDLCFSELSRRLSLSQEV